MRSVVHCKDVCCDGEPRGTSTSIPGKGAAHPKVLRWDLGRLARTLTWLEWSELGRE